MAKEIQNEYEKLTRRYKLPKFKDADIIFEISTIEDTMFLLRSVIGKIDEKLDYYARLLEELLQPDTSSLSSMHEIRFFNEQEKNEIYKLYKKLMKLRREAVEAYLIVDEKYEADYINNAFNKWLEIKEELLRYVKKMKESWDKDTNIEEDLHYLG